jgi:hypothetical protein
VKRGAWYDHPVGAHALDYVTGMPAARVYGSIGAAPWSWVAWSPHGHVLSGDGMQEHSVGEGIALAEAALDREEREHSEAPR